MSGLVLGAWVLMAVWGSDKPVYFATREACETAREAKATRIPGQNTGDKFWRCLPTGAP